MFLHGEGYRPSEFTHRGKILNYDLYLVGADLPAEIGGSEESVKVEMGDLRKVKKNEVAYSVGANPCMIVVPIMKNGGIWLLHSYGPYPDSNQEKLIKKAIGGIAGGSPKQLGEYSGIFAEKNIRSIRSLDPDADFNVSIVRRKIRDIPSGIHYGYGNIFNT